MLNNYGCLTCLDSLELIQKIFKILGVVKRHKSNYDLQQYLGDG